MPVSRAVAAAQVYRFRYHARFPNQDGQDALVDVFQKACETDGAAEEVGDYLEQTLKFAPVAANIFEAVDVLTERRRYTNQPKSPYAEPGEEVWHLADSMNPEDVAKWHFMAEHGKTQAQRDLARAFANYTRKRES